MFERLDALLSDSSFCHWLQWTRFFLIKLNTKSWLNIHFFLHLNSMVHAMVWFPLSPFNFHYYFCKLLTQPSFSLFKSCCPLFLKAVQQLVATGFIVLMFHPTFIIALYVVLQQEKWRTYPRQEKQCENCDYKKKTGPVLWFWCFLSTEVLESKKLF